MGNNDSKKKDLTPQMMKSKATFQQMSKSKSFVTRNDLKESWENLIDHRLMDCMLNYLFLNKAELRLKEFTDLVGILLQGSPSEKAETIMKIVLVSNQNPRVALEMFLQDIFKTVCLIESRIARNCIQYWTKGQTTENTFNRLISYYLSSIQDATNITELVNMVDPFLSMTFEKLFGIDEITTSFFPRLKEENDKICYKSSTLALEDVIFLNMLLPVDYQRKWRLLFSSQIHGESFSRFSGQIVNQGPTLLVMMDKDRYVFGGFAPSNWSFGPKFVGDSSSFLFTLRPKINVFNPSNFNGNFQYLNQGQQTLPNGLGMGGALNYFGLWIDSEYGSGRSNDSCTTYSNFSKLSNKREFHLSEIEVWGVGPPPHSGDESTERSILDGNSEAKAMLELVGRYPHSEGLREEPNG